MAYRLRNVPIVKVYEHWFHECGYCGHRCQVAVTRNYMLVCSNCGRW